MPVIAIEIVGEIAAMARRGLATRIANAAANVLSAPPGSVWVRLRFTPSDQYAENAAGEAVPGADTSRAQPVFVSVVLRAWPARGLMAEEARALAAAIGLACQRPTEEIHVIYEPPGEGRVAFGGTLVE